MPKLCRAGRSWQGLAVFLIVLAVGAGGAGTAQQQPQEPQGQTPAQETPPADPQATFRAGINFVRVDVIVTDGRSGFVTNLTRDDFEVTEDGRPQSIEQFRLIRVDGNPRSDAPPPSRIRTREDEELAANREDVRIFAILLDDYHVRKENAMAIRAPLTQFIRTQLRPNDLIAVMYPLTPVTAITFTNDHDEVVRALERFEGRKYDYTPRNIFEQQYSRYPTETVERIRNDVVMSAIQGLSVRMGSLREGRKALIFVSEGFTAFLPPQMRARIADQGNNPIEAELGARSQDSPAEQTAAWFGQSDVYNRMREVHETANRHNTSIYSLDPRGLAVFEFSIGDTATSAAAPSFETDRRSLQMSQDTLRTLSEETDGRAIVNRNTLGEGLAQIVRDSSVYYLLGYNSSQAVNDGKFHEIEVRVKRRGVDVRARKGYWAMTADDVIRASNPTPEVAKPVQDALASISTSVQAGKYVRTWVGMQRGDNGKTRVTLTWEPLPESPGAARREQAGRLAVLAADAAGDLVYRGRAPDADPPAAKPSNAPQQLTFDAPPGRLELRLTVQAAGSGGTLDQEIRAIEVPDLTAPQAAVSTPRVYRGRTPRELQTYAADANAIPVATREFSRTERLLIRFDAYGAGTEQPTATAVLLNRAGQKMSDVQVAPAQAGGTHQIDLRLASVPAGEYLVEITVRSASGEAKELVPLRVTS